MSMTQTTRNEIQALINKIVGKKIARIKETPEYKKALASALEAVPSDVLSPEQKLAYDAAIAAKRAYDNAESHYNVCRSALRDLIEHDEKLKTGGYFYGTPTQQVENVLNRVANERADEVTSSHIATLETFIDNISGTILMATSETKLALLINKMYKRFGDADEIAYLNLLEEIFPDILEE